MRRLASQRQTSIEWCWLPTAVLQTHARADCACWLCGGLRLGVCMCVCVCLCVYVCVCVCVVSDSHGVALPLADVAILKKQSCRVRGGGAQGNQR